jgi:phospholipase D1/2
MTTWLDRAKDAFNTVAADTKRLAGEISDKFDSEKHSHTHLHSFCHALHYTVHNRFHSFAPPRTQNSAKWFVDGCGYFWALSVALEQAQSQILIMDWWLSPELYLRRPPSKNEQYRLDHMLQAAAQRGVKVNVMVYKEVENILTRKLLSPLSDLLQYLSLYSSEILPKYFVRKKVIFSSYSHT